MPAPTVAEILAELEAAQKSIDTPDGCFSIAEMRTATGWGDMKVRASLKKAKDAGRLEVKKVHRETLMGTLHPVPVYRILPAGKKR